MPRPDLSQPDPVVLLHSSGASGAQWRALAERLAKRYRVFTPDLCGYGTAAPWSGSEPFRLAHEARIVHDLVQSIGEPVHLLGHSYGGAVALHFARLNGALVRSLALVEPVAFHLLDDRAEIEAVAGKVARAVACGDFVGGFGAFVEYWSGPGSWDALPAAKRAAMAARLPKVAMEFHAVLSEVADMDAYREINNPTLIVRGALSPRPTRRICELLAQALPEARLVTLEGAGHMAPLTHADQVNDLVAGHLEEPAFA